MKRLNKKHLSAGRTSPTSVPLTELELRRLIEVLSSDPRFLILLIAVNLVLRTGIRVLELLAVRWSDIDLVNGRLALPSGSGSRLVVGISPEICRLLEHTVQEPPTEYLFSRVAITRAQRQLARIARQLGTPLTFHRLRRTSITQARLSGAPKTPIPKIAHWRDSTFVGFSNVAPKLPRTGPLYKRGETWWMRYRIGDRFVRESCHTRRKHVAEQVLLKRLSEYFGRAD